MFLALALDGVGGSCGAATVGSATWAIGVGNGVGVGEYAGVGAACCSRAQAAIGMQPSTRHSIRNTVYGRCCITQPSPTKIQLAL